MHAIVVGKWLLGMDAVFDIAGISAPGGIVIKLSTEVIFFSTEWVCGNESVVLLIVNVAESSVWFDMANWTWAVMWK